MVEQAKTVSFMPQKMQSVSMEQQQQARPAYTIEAASRTTIVNKAVKDELGFRIIPTEEKLDGYIVKTFRGDSVFLKHEDVLRLKLNRNLIPMVVDGGDDTAVGMMPNAALSDKHKTALEVLTQLLDKNPALVEQLLAQSEDEEK